MDCNLTAVKLQSNHKKIQLPKYVSWHHKIQCDALHVLKGLTNLLLHDIEYNWIGFFFKLSLEFQIKDAAALCEYFQWLEDEVCYDLRCDSNYMNSNIILSVIFCAIYFVVSEKSRLKCLFFLI